MGIEKKVVSFRIDEGLLDELKVIADSENRPMSNLVETIIKQYLNARKAAEK